MNLPEYREAVRGAQRRFNEALHKAEETLAADLAKADDNFFMEQDVPVERTEPAEKRLR